MNTQDPLDIVRHFAAVIQNGRTLHDISRHLDSEHMELKEELYLIDEGKSPGPDGVLGESIDIMACALDAIFVHAPQTTNEQICEILLKKCEKWARRYSRVIDGDRSIE